MMKKIILTIFLSFAIASLSFAQFEENFSDSDLSNNPSWLGQIDSFKVTSQGELQLNAKSAGNVIIGVNYTLQQEMAWEFLVRMDFSPSNSNRTIIHLIRNGLNTTATEGYYLLIGEDGSSDKIKLYRANDNSLLATCPSIFIVNNLVNTRLRVKRNATNNWTIEADYNGGYAFKPEISFQENNVPAPITNATFSINCEFSATRADKFFYDDLKVYKNEPDISAPKIISIGQDSKISNRVNLIFNEVIDSTSAKAFLAYQLSNGGGIPQKITYGFDKVALDFQSLLPDTKYTMIVSTIKDLTGNVISPAQLTFTTAALPSTTSAQEIIINEIMADPLPQIGLPKAEYIELYNRSNKTIQLEGFSLKDKGATLYKLPKFSLKPSAYVIVYKREKGIDFGKYGDTLALSSLFALDSDNEIITLFNEKNEIIDQVQFGLSSYNDEKKSEGGWSIELINPNTSCLGGYNFTASKSEDGGTPGKQNSAFSITIDKTPFVLTYAFPNNTDEILCRFNKNIDEKTLQNTTFDISLGIKNIAVGITKNEIKIQLNSPMQEGVIYDFLVKKNLKDCIGNELEEVKIPIGLSENIDSKDIVINEVLFNPKTNGVDFIEIYNRSKKIININDLNIDNRKKFDAQEIEVNYLLFPNSYVVLTENKSILLNQNYKIKNPNAVIETPLPSFDDEEGNVMLIKADAPGKLIIDEMDYEKNYHYPLLKDQDGVSLERINVEGNSLDKNNWYSAASTANFATPTYENSQFYILKNNQTDIFSLETKRISPDGDGFEDFLLINFKSSIIGLTATIKIFDLEGRVVKTLINNETINTEGTIRWDGDTNENSKTPIGIYIIQIDAFATDGTIIKEKKTISVVTNL